MNTHGYRLVANSKTASPDFFPSLVGLERDQVTPAGTDTYFERVEIEDAEITTITISRWVSYENISDPILGAKLAKGPSFYIPASELVANAIEANDTTVLAMLAKLPGILR